MKSISVKRNEEFEIIIEDEKLKTRVSLDDVVGEVYKPLGGKAKHFGVINLRIKSISVITTDKSDT